MHSTAGLKQLSYILEREAGSAEAVELLAARMPAFAELQAILDSPALVTFLSAILIRHMGRSSVPLHDMVADE